MFEQELKDLITISHYLGKNPELIQAGGGNTSVKTQDKKTMLIKASGSAMVDMTVLSGWVGVERDRLQRLFEDTSIRNDSPAEREKKVLEILYGSVVANQGSRPSVETPLHLLLDKVVMHSHPVVGNALTCHKNGEAILKELAGQDGRMQPLWVPYIDPGASLAFGLYDTINAYFTRYKRWPETIFLQNHGLFCAAETVEACINLHEYWIRKVGNYFKAPLKLVSKKYAAPNSNLSLALEAVCTELQKDALVVKFCNDPICFDALESPVISIFKGALTPDHVVYIGPQALFLERDGSQKEYQEAIQKFFTRFGILPRLFVVKETGIAVAGTSPGALAAGQALVKSAINIALWANNEVSLMDARGIDFIVHWEAEHYRAKQVGN